MPMRSGKAIALDLIVAREQKLKVIKEEVVMFAPKTTESTGFKQCQLCGAELLERDKFCRRCGIDQSGNGITTPLTTELANYNYETRPLRQIENISPGFSGTLVKILAQSILSQTSLCQASRFVTRSIAVLVTIPIWLMIVFLSPLEAYAAARTITRQEKLTMS